MADDTSDPPAATNAEAAAAQAIKVPPKAKAATKAEETVQVANEPDNELHQVEDLVASSSRIYGVPPEVVAGAAHFAGLEMTSESTIPALADHIKAFMAQPA